MTTKGVTYAPIGNRRKPIYDKLSWSGIDKRGVKLQQNIDNPLLGPARFAEAAANRLKETNPRWKTAHIEPVMVFPTDATKLLSDLGSNDKYLDLDRFKKRLAAGDGRATPRWMIDDLSRLPAWDTIERGNGSLSQAALEGEGIVLIVRDGPVDVPFASVAKIEVSKVGIEDADFSSATVTLKDGQVLIGAVAEQQIITNRRGFRETHDLRNLRAICPGQFLLAA